MEKYPFFNGDVFIIFACCLVIILYDIYFSKAYKIFYVIGLPTKLFDKLTPPQIESAYAVYGAILLTLFQSLVAYLYLSGSLYYVKGSEIYLYRAANAVIHIFCLYITMSVYRYYYLPRKPIPSQRGNPGLVLIIAPGLWFGAAVTLTSLYFYYIYLLIAVGIFVLNVITIKKNINYSKN